MLLICRSCDKPLNIPAGFVWAKHQQVECPCGAAYMISVDQIKYPSPEVEKKISEERRSRVLHYQCATCGTKLGVDLICPKCPRPEPAA